MTERQLIDIAILDERWSEATSDVFREDAAIEVQVEHFGLKLADSVIVDELKVKELREFVSWANGLDHEAVTTAGSTIANLSVIDQREAVARRIAHLSGRFALALVKSHDRRQAHRIQYGQRIARLRATDNIGLFRVEAKDLGL